MGWMGGSTPITSPAVERVMFPATDAETTAGVPPPLAGIKYPPGNEMAGSIERQGASTASADNSVEVGNVLLARHAMFVPEGTWKIGPEDCQANQYVYGVGRERSILQAVSGADTMLKMNSGGVIRDLTLDGNFQVALGSSFAVLELGGDNVLCDNVLVKNVNRWGIRMQDYLHATIRNCFFTLAAGASGVAGEVQHFIYAVGALSSDRAILVVDGNYFYDPLHATVGYGPAGIYVEQTAALARVAIVNNKFDGCGFNNGAGNFSAPIDLYAAGDGSVVANNSISNYIYFGIKLESAAPRCIGNNVISPADANQFAAIQYAPNGHAATPQSRAIIVANLIDAAATVGINCTGNNTVGQISDILIAENIVKGAGTDGVALEYSADYRVIGNFIQGAGGNGIQTQTSQGAFALNQNTIRDCADAAIRMSAEASGADAVVNGNQCIENGAATGNIHLMLRNLKSLDVRGNVVQQAAGAGKTGIDIASIANRLHIGSNNVRVVGGTQWNVAQGALADADFFHSPDSGYVRTYAGDPNGNITVAFPGQVVLDTGTNTVYFGRAAGTTAWAT